PHVPSMLSRLLGTPARGGDDDDDDGGASNASASTHSLADSLASRSSLPSSQSSTAWEPAPPSHPTPRHGPSPAPYHRYPSSFDDDDFDDDSRPTSAAARAAVAAATSEHGPYDSDSSLETDDLSVEESYLSLTPHAAPLPDDEEDDPADPYAHIAASFESLARPPTLQANEVVLQTRWFHAVHRGHLIAVSDLLSSHRALIGARSPVPTPYPAPLVPEATRYLGEDTTGMDALQISLLRYAATQLDPGAKPGGEALETCAAVLHVLIDNSWPVELDGHRYGRTANTSLHLAAFLSQGVVVDRLLDQGATASIRNGLGMYPFEVTDTASVRQRLLGVMQDERTGRRPRQQHRHDILSPEMGVAMLVDGAREAQPPRRGGHLSLRSHPRDSDEDDDSAYGEGRAGSGSACSSPVPPYPNDGDDEDDVESAGDPPLHLGDLESPLSPPTYALQRATLVVSPLGLERLTPEPSFSSDSFHTADSQTGPAVAFDAGARTSSPTDPPLARHASTVRFNDQPEYIPAGDLASVTTAASFSDDQLSLASSHGSEMDDLVDHVLNDTDGDPDGLYDPDSNSPWLLRRGLYPRSLSQSGILHERLSPEPSVPRAHSFQPAFPDDEATPAPATLDDAHGLAAAAEEEDADRPWFTVGSQDPPPAPAFNSRETAYYEKVLDADRYPPELGLDNDSQVVWATTMGILNQDPLPAAQEHALRARNARLYGPQPRRSAFREGPGAVDALLSSLVTHEPSPPRAASPRPASPRAASPRPASPRPSSRASAVADYIDASLRSRPTHSPVPAESAAPPRRRLSPTLDRLDRRQIVTGYLRDRESPGRPLSPATPPPALARPLPAAHRPVYVRPMSPGIRSPEVRPRPTSASPTPPSPRPRPSPLPLAADQDDTDNSPTPLPTSPTVTTPTTPTSPKTRSPRLMIPSYPLQQEFENLISPVRQRHNLGDETPFLTVLRHLQNDRLVRRHSISGEAPRRSPVAAAVSGPMPAATLRPPNSLERRRSLPHVTVTNPPSPTKRSRPDSAVAVPGSGCVSPASSTREDSGSDRGDPAFRSGDFAGRIIARPPSSLAANPSLLSDPAETTIDRVARARRLLQPADPEAPLRVGLYLTDADRPVPTLRPLPTGGSDPPPLDGRQLCALLSRDLAALTDRLGRPPLTEFDRADPLALHPDAREVASLWEAERSAAGGLSGDSTVPSSPGRVDVAELRSRTPSPTSAWFTALPFNPWATAESRFPFLAWPLSTSRVLTQLAHLRTHPAAAGLSIGHDLPAYPLLASDVAQLVAARRPHLRRWLLNVSPAERAVLMPGLRDLYPDLLGSLLDEVARLCHPTPLPTTTTSWPLRRARSLPRLAPSLPRSSLRRRSLPDFGLVPSPDLTAVLTRDLRAVRCELSLLTVWDWLRSSEDDDQGPESFATIEPAPSSVASRAPFPSDAPLDPATAVRDALGDVASLRSESPVASASLRDGSPERAWLAQWHALLAYFEDHGSSAWRGMPDPGEVLATDNPDPLPELPRLVDGHVVGMTQRMKEAELGLLSSDSSLASRMTSRASLPSLFDPPPPASETPVAVVTKAEPAPTQPPAVGAGRDPSPETESKQSAGASADDTPAAVPAGVENRPWPPVSEPADRSPGLSRSGSIAPSLDDLASDPTGSLSSRDARPRSTHADLAFFPSMPSPNLAFTVPAPAASSPPKSPWLLAATETVPVCRTPSPVTPRLLGAASPLPAPITEGSPGTISLPAALPSVSSPTSSALRVVLDQFPPPPEPVRSTCWRFRAESDPAAPTAAYPDTLSVSDPHLAPPLSPEFSAWLPPATTATPPMESPPARGFSVVRGALDQLSDLQRELGPTGPDDDDRDVESQILRSLTSDPALLSTARESAWLGMEDVAGALGDRSTSPGLLAPLTVSIPLLSAIEPPEIVSSPVLEPHVPSAPSPPPLATPVASPPATLTSHPLPAYANPFAPISTTEACFRPPRPFLDRGHVWVRLLSLDQMAFTPAHPVRALYLVVHNENEVRTTLPLPADRIENGSVRINQEFRIPLGAETTLLFWVRLQTTAPARPASPLSAPSPARRLGCLPLPRRSAPSHPTIPERRSSLPAASVPSFTATGSVTPRVARDRPAPAGSASSLLSNASVFKEETHGSVTVNLRDILPRVFAHKYVGTWPVESVWVDGPAGQLVLQLFYLPSIPHLLPREIPHTFRDMLETVAAAEWHTHIWYHGYLYMRGLDAPFWRRRYFKLEGAFLLAYHEDTKAPKLLVDLTMADRVLDLSAGKSAGTTSQSGRRHRAASRRVYRADAGASTSQESVTVDHPPHALAIKFRDDGNTLELYADSAETQRHWLTALRKVVGHVPRVPTWFVRLLTLGTAAPSTRSRRSPFVTATTGHRRSRKTGTSARSRGRAPRAGLPEFVAP
ncbi:Bud site selection protein bud4, partial [Tieghemiomyces parasiticus]